MKHERVEEQHHIEMERLEEKHAAELLRLKKAKEEEHRQLKEGFEVLKGAMVKRDRFKPISDRDLWI